MTVRVHVWVNNADAIYRHPSELSECRSNDCPASARKSCFKKILAEKMHMLKTGASHADQKRHGEAHEWPAKESGRSAGSGGL